MELALLKLFSTKDCYDKYIDRIKDNPLSNESQWVLKHYKQWYEDKDTDIDFTTFKDYCFHAIPNELTDDKKEIYSTIIDKVQELDSDVPEDILRTYQVADKAEDLIAQLEELSSGQTSPDLVAEELKTTADFFLQNKDVDYNLISIDREEESEEDAYYTKWKLDVLNQCSAGLTGGNFVIVMGRSNSGKTSLVIQETCNRYKELHGQGKNPGPVLWVNNEESFVKSIENRIFSYLTDHPTSVIQKDVAGKNNLRKKVQAHYGDIYQCLEDSKDSKVTPALVEQVVEDIKPCAVVFNNLDKLCPRDSDRGHTQLGNLYRWARNLAISYDVPVFAVCQASADAEDSKAIFQTMAQDSKTDKPGEADFMIGIGALIADDVVDGAVTRYINVCKNKLPEGTVEGMREVYSRPCSFYIRTGKYDDKGVQYD
jgi:GTP-binding protein EngB required for normal cell division